MLTHSIKQLDDRYFKGLEGQYWFDLEFLLQEEGAEEDDYIVRARSTSPWGDRSISAEVTLKPGKYEVLPRITAARDTSRPVVEAVVKLAAENNPKKLRQIGMNYDIAHAKGGFELELAQEKDRVRRKKEKEVKRQKEERLKMEEAAKKAAEDMIKEEQKEALMEEIKTEMKEEDKGEGSKDADESKERAEEETFADAKGDAKVETTEEKGKGSEGSKKDPKEEPKDESKEVAKEKPEKNVREVKEVKEDAKTHSRHISDPGDARQTQTHKDEVEVTKVHEPEKKALDSTKPQPPGEEEGQNAEDTEKEKDEKKKEGEPEKPKPSDVEPADNPWNAVTVIGLLVYSKDHDAKVTLVKPAAPEDDVLL
jgi:hypothetical protein